MESFKIIESDSSNLGNLQINLDASHVIVYDGVESVSNGDDRAVGKLCPDGLLNEVVCLKVHSSCGLVQNQDLGLTEEGSSQAHQLTLTNTVE